MTKGPPPPTPSRRSKRFQPLATPSRARVGASESVWVGGPIYVRPANPELDILQDEQENDEAEALETVFYEAFEMRNKAFVGAGGGGSSKGKGKEQMRRYQVGDTVLVVTDTLSRVRRPPSVAVIVALWETRLKGGEEEESDQSKMRVRVHWFLRPTELAGIRAKREHTENEIYYSLASSEILIPEVILSHCNVTSKAPQRAITKSTDAWSLSPTKRRLFQSPSDDESEGSEDGGEQSGDDTFYCHLAVNSMRGLFYGLKWDEHQQMALGAPTDGLDASQWGDGSIWDVDVAEDAPITTKRSHPAAKRGPRKRVKLDRSDSESDGDTTGDEFVVLDDDDGEGEDDDDLPTVMRGDSALSDISEGEEDENDASVEPRTPSKNRKRKRARPAAAPRSPTKRSTATSTPRRSRTKTLVHPTPTSKAAYNQRKVKATPKRKFTVRPRSLTYAVHDLSYLPKDPWLRAMHVLHVGSRPDALPCREEEYDRVLRCVGELLEEGSGGCIYISGVPGTGKTATVHAIVRELKRMAESSEINPFTYVEINGLRIPEPSAAYNLLWEAVSGHDVAKDGHLRVGAKESLKALTRHFSGGGGRGRGPGGHACVVLMDELDQLVTAKQDVVYNFFNWPTLVGSKLVVLAVANTMDLPERVMTGRVRSRLGMIRINFQPYTTSQLEQIVQARLLSAKEGTESDVGPDVIATDGIKFAAMKVSSISGDARRVLDICRRTVELVQPKRRVARMGDVRQVIQVMQNSPTAAYLRECSFHEQLMLASLVKCIKREGVEEIKWGEVQHQHLIYMNVLTSSTDPTRKPTLSELNMVLDSLVASRAMLVEDGVAASRKAEGERRVILNLEQGEVERVLSEVGPAWKNVLSG